MSACVRVVACGCCVCCVLWCYCYTYTRTRIHTHTWRPPVSLYTRTHEDISECKSGKELLTERSLCIYVCVCVRLCVCASCAYALTTHADGISTAGSGKMTESTEEAWFFSRTVRYGRRFGMEMSESPWSSRDPPSPPSAGTASAVLETNEMDAGSGAMNHLHEQQMSLRRTKHGRCGHTAVWCCCVPLFLSPCVIPSFPLSFLPPCPVLKPVL